jgi:hypothetical protein
MKKETAKTEVDENKIACKLDILGYVNSRELAILITHYLEIMCVEVESGVRQYPDCGIKKVGSDKYELPTAKFWEITNTVAPLFGEDVQF